jgi:hypothetical protein
VFRRLAASAAALRDAPLTPAEAAAVADVTSASRGAASDPLVKAHAVELTRNDLRVLAQGVWLKDEAINFYIAMLRLRSTALAAAAMTGLPPDAPPLPPASLARGCWLANTFFFPKLSEDARSKHGRVLEPGYCYANVKRWTKRDKVDIFACRAVLVPLNYGNQHWALAVIHMAEKRIEVLDSLGGNERSGQVARKLLRWLGDEFKNKAPKVREGAGAGAALDGGRGCGSRRGSRAPHHTRPPLPLLLRTPPSAPRSGTRLASPSRRRPCRTTALTAAPSCWRASTFSSWG